jgi:cysteine desulfurase
VRVYLDHNATTPIRPEARELLLAGLDQGFGNPSSVHAAGRRGRACIDEARARVAAALAVHEEEVVFTSGGTEANNLALFGAVRASGARAGLATSRAEHPSVLEAAAELARAGHPLGIARVDAEGRPTRSAPFRRSPSCARGSSAARPARPRSCTSTRSRRSGACRSSSTRGARGSRASPRTRWAARPAWGCSCGAAGWRSRPCCSAAGLRAGTENPAAIAAAACAIELAVRERADAAARWRGLASRLWGGLRAALPDATLLGPAIDAPDRLPNTLNVLFPGIDGRAFVARLDLEGLEASAGSACASGSLEASHVLLAMGLDERDARAGLRLSLGRTSDERVVDRAVEILSRTVESLRTAR